ncbi:hypothetical protein O3P69_005738 [Scylla paramamosain]|uniref:Uncharacterized protein n=1 Tax=Scylla paramamosain TaxID=85552 RepID=A0AAW0UA58_SCYPA
MRRRSISAGGDLSVSVKGGRLVLLLMCLFLASVALDVGGRGRAAAPLPLDLGARVVHLVKRRVCRGPGRCSAHAAPDASLHAASPAGAAPTEC